MTAENIQRPDSVLPVAAIPVPELADFLGRFGLQLTRVAANAPILGSFWGATEAGLTGDQLHARPDTPVHSVLHEACHYICMSPEQRDGLDTDAGGDTHEENAACYLQILLADHVPGMGQARMFADMDAWGYTFRLGSAKAWFQKNAEDARDWLVAHGLIDSSGTPTWRCRGNTATDLKPSRE